MPRQVHPWSRDARKQKYVTQLATGSYLSLETGALAQKVEARPDRDHKDHKTAQTDPYIRSLAVL